MFATADAEWVRRLRELHLLTPARIVVILVVAWVLTVVIRRLVDRLVRGLQVVQERTLPRADPTRSEQRRRTLTTVLRSTMVALVWLTAFVTVVSELGVNLGAFVATATIIGGALAFGAQTLVRDLIAGFFLIAEDQFGVGDIVDLGPATGVVERVSLRVTRLRDVEGRVWYVPNGQVARVANMSHQNATAVIDLPVPIGQDLDATGARLLALAADLRDDPAVGSSVVDEPRYLGVQDLVEDRALLRIVFTTQPSQQFVVRRAYLGRIAAAVRAGEIPPLAITGMQKEVVVREGASTDAVTGGLD